MLAKNDFLSQNDQAAFALVSISTKTGAPQALILTVGTEADAVNALALLESVDPRNVHMSL